MLVGNSSAAYRMFMQENAMAFMIENTSRTVWRCMLACALLASIPASAEKTKIYRSYDASGKGPIFSDQPINRTSHVFAMFDGTLLWPRSGTGPVSIRELAMRRDALEPLVQRVAKMHGVHAALLKAVIEVESGFNARA